MITRIEIDGFKSFSNFELDLRPFQVIIGANGVGKSNLFDALMLLSRLANGASLFDALNTRRGSVLEQFALLEDGSRSKQMQFAVEILLPKKFKAFVWTGGKEVWQEVPETRFRYELRIMRREEPSQGLYIDNETIYPIPKDKWANPRVRIDTDTHSLVTRGASDFKEINELSSQTGFSLMARGSELFEPILKSMKQLQSLQFNPTTLKQTSSSFAPAEALLPDGSNLAAVLYRMNTEDEFALNDIARDMMSLNQNIKAIKVTLDEVRDDIFFQVQDQNNNWLSPNVLSDGTLRTLAFVTLRNDPNFEGVLCIEEPENGVHPLVLEKLVKMLQSMATDFSDTEMPLRQVIINSHSPALLAYVDIQDIAYMYMPRHNPRITAVGTVSDETADEAKRLFTKYQIMNFLNAVPKNEPNHA